MTSNYKFLIIIFILAVVLFSGCSRDNYDAVKIQLNGNGINIKGSDSIKIDDGIIEITEGGVYSFSGEGQDIQIYVDCTDMVTLLLDDLQIVNDEIAAIKIESDSNVLIESIGKNENVIKLTDQDSKQCIKSDGTLTISGEIPIVLEGKDCIKADMLIIQSAHIDMHPIENAVKADYIFVTDSKIEINSLYDDSYGIYSKDSVELIQSDISIATVNDCIHSQQAIKIEDSTFNLETNDDAIHARENISILSGNIMIEKCLEGIEGNSIDIYDGAIHITSDNDGINAVSEDENEMSAITINGGEIIINADGDGLDANGYIHINGGVVFISGAYGGDNNAIDFDTEFLINGGAVIAAGNNLDAKPPSEDSMQNSVMFIYDDIQTAETGFAIVDESNSALIAADFFKPYDNLIISIPNMELERGYYFAETVSVTDDYIYPIADNQVQFEVKTNRAFNLYNKVSLIWR